MSEQSIREFRVTLSGAKYGIDAEDIEIALGNAGYAFGGVTVTEERRAGEPVETLDGIAERLSTYGVVHIHTEYLDHVDGRIWRVGVQIAGSSDVSDYGSSFPEALSRALDRFDERKVRLTVTLSEEAAQALKNLADRMGKSISDVVRDAILTEKQRKEDPADAE